LRHWSFVFLFVHAKQRRTSLQRDDEHEEAAAAIFCLLGCTSFVWCVCECTSVFYLRRRMQQQQVREASIHATTTAAAEARKQTSWARQQQTTNKRTDERRRASADAALAAELFVLRPNARAVARARDRPGASVLQPTNKCAGARNRRCCDGFVQRSQM
jgi:hypothetical protein